MWQDAISLFYYQKATKRIECYLKIQKETTHWKERGSQWELFVKIAASMLKEAATASYSWKRDVPPLH